MVDDQAKHVIDALSLGTVVATLTGILPAVAAFISIIWTSIRIFETRTVRNWMYRIGWIKNRRTRTR